MNTTSIHPFEAAGLGQAPFQFLYVRANVYSSAPGHSQPGGTCAYCFNGIKYEYWIQSNDGVKSPIGCDCIRKLDRTDNKLISDVERAAAQLRRDALLAKREAAYQARQEARNAELEAQRKRNGGLTDREVLEAAAAAHRAAQAAQAAQDNEWLINVLHNHTTHNGDFCSSMIKQLKQHPLRDMSARCINILRDIYAKHHGRRNSKAYKQAEAEFTERMN